MLKLALNAGGVALLDLVSDYFGLFFKKNSFFYLLVKGLVLIMFLPIKYLDKFFAKEEIANSLYIIAKK